MGYRTYIAIIEKKKLNALRKCNSIDDVVCVFEKYGWRSSKVGAESRNATQEAIRTFHRTEKRYQNMDHSRAMRTG